MLGHDRWEAALAVLSDGRVVSGDADGWVLVWDPATPGAGPVEFGHHDSAVAAVVVLPDGRVVSDDADGRLLVWEPTSPGAGTVELGRHPSAVPPVMLLPTAVPPVAVLPDGRVVSGGADERVLIWDVTTQSEIAQVQCSVQTLAAGLLDADRSALVIAHRGGGFSLWSVIDQPHG
jgi:WD40 repeat protein